VQLRKAKLSVVAAIKSHALSTVSHGAPSIIHDAVGCTRENSGVSPTASGSMTPAERTHHVKPAFDRSHRNSGGISFSSNLLTGLSITKNLVTQLLSEEQSTKQVDRGQRDAPQHARRGDLLQQLQQQLVMLYDAAQSKQLSNHSHSNDPDEASGGTMLDRSQIHYGDQGGETISEAERLASEPWFPKPRSADDGLSSLEFGCRLIGSRHADRSGSHLTMSEPMETLPIQVGRELRATDTGMPWAQQTFPSTEHGTSDGTHEDGDILSEISLYSSGSSTDSDSFQISNIPHDWKQADFPRFLDVHEDSIDERSVSAEELQLYVQQYRQATLNGIGSTDLHVDFSQIRSPSGPKGVRQDQKGTPTSQLSGTDADADAAASLRTRPESAESDPSSAAAKQSPPALEPATTPEPADGETRHIQVPSVAVEVEPEPELQPITWLKSDFKPVLELVSEPEPETLPEPRPAALQLGPGPGLEPGGAGPAALQLGPDLEPGPAVLQLGSEPQPQLQLDLEPQLQLDAQSPPPQPQPLPLPPQPLPPPPQPLPLPQLNYRPNPQLESKLLLGSVAAAGFGPGPEPEPEPGDIDKVAQVVLVDRIANLLEEDLLLVPPRLLNSLSCMPRRHRAKTC
jgi:hypothetical protein